MGQTPSPSLPHRDAKSEKINTNAKNLHKKREKSDKIQITTNKRNYFQN